MRSTAHIVETPAPVGGRFAPGREYTVGVEEELMLLDTDTLSLRSAIEPLLSGWVGDGLAKRELMQCQAEVNTPPCRTGAEVLEALTRVRTELNEAGEPHGVRIATAGTHPFSREEEQEITASPRYRNLAAEVQYPARRVVVFGMHVHVAVGGGDKTLQVIEALIRDLPLLLALSTSSPFWRGEETGLASTRVIVGQSMPRAGLPPAFESYDEFASSLDRLRRAGAVADFSHLWWDVRPHADFGTVEVRIMDAQPRVEDSAALAALVQALVRHYGMLYDRGAGFPRANRLIEAENRWLAARHGLHARLVTDADEAHPARALVVELLDRIAPDAAALGSSWALETIADILGRGTSAERQLDLHRDGRELVDIVQALVDESAVG